MRPTHFHRPSPVLAAALCLSAATCAAGAPSLRFAPLNDRSGRVNAQLGVARCDAALMKFDASPGLPFDAVIPVDGRAVTVNLRPETVRAPGFRVLFQTADGSWHDADPGPVTTYVGTSPELPGARIGAALSADGLTAQVAVPGAGVTYWVEPAAGRIDSPERAAGELLHVAYAGSDVLPPAGSCGADTLPPPPGTGRLTRPGDAGFERAACGTACVAELACDADFEFFSRYGSSVALTQARIEHVMSQVNFQYISEMGIRHQITTILVRTSAQSNPYTTSNSGGLLAQFQAEWNAHQTAIPRDVAQLFTGRILSGNTLGVAFRGTVCDPANAYCAVASDCCASFGLSTDLSAHELGHTWNAQHCPCQAPNPISTMNASLTGANTFLTDSSGQSAISIRGWRDTVTCLSPEVAAPPPGSCDLISPPNGAFGVPVPAALDWTDAPGAAFYVVRITSDPDLITLVHSAATLTSSYVIPSSVVGNATRLYWAVDAWDDRGRSTRWASGAPGFITALAPPACPGDVTNDHQVDMGDLTVLLGFFGSPVSSPGTLGDLNGDAIVNTQDLTLLLLRFGSVCR